MTPPPMPKKMYASGVLANIGMITLFILNFLIVIFGTKIIVYHIHYPPITWLRWMIESDSDGSRLEGVVFIVLFVIIITLYLICLAIIHIVVPLFSSLNRIVVLIQNTLNKLNPILHSDRLVLNRALVISSATLFPIYFISTYFLIISPTVNSNVSDIISKQEESIGIKHIGKPNIILEFLPPEFSFFTIWRAAYNRKTDEIIIYLSSWLLDPVPYDELVGHELGHYYIKKRMEGFPNVKNKNIVDFAKRLRRPIFRGNQSVCSRSILNEGISEYFKFKAVADHVIIARTIHADIPTKCPSHDRPIGYIEAYQAVKSIIDAHGESAIDYLWLYPPTRFDRESIASYQELALRELKERE